MEIVIGAVKVELHNVNIHTPDSTVAYISTDKILLPGDTIEDSVVFISTPDNVAEQISNLTAMQDWDIARIYPNHGNIAVIRKGGYDKGLIEATRIYLRIRPGSRLLKYLPRSGDWSIARQGLDQFMGALSTRSRRQPQAAA